MKKAMTVLLISFLLSVLGCSTGYYYINIQHQTNQKKEFLSRLINYPEKYDSLLKSSVFFDSTYSHYMVENKKRIVNDLTNFKSHVKDEPIIDDEFVLLGKDQILVHELGLVCSDNHLLNVIFHLYNSKWYVITIIRFNQRIQNREMLKRPPSKNDP